MTVCVSFSPDIKESFNQWSYVCVNFGISPENAWWRHEATGKEIFGYYAEQSHELADEICPDIPLILVQSTSGILLQGKTNLVNFVHPPDALYLFGGDASKLSIESDVGTREVDDIIYIPTADDANMYSFMAGALVFYDRMIKNGN